jgi:hypothetical protein
MKNISSAFYRNEKYFFLLNVLLHTLPIFTLTYFVTHDGPGHLYNSNLINSLLFDRDSRASSIFEFTPGIVPNWTGHLLLCIFNLFLNAPLAEKVFQLLYIFSFAYSFRFLVKSIPGADIVASWLCFPFIYSFTFHIGFYSFSIGLCILFIVLGIFRNDYSIKTKRRFILISLCMMGLYLSHLFVFAAAFMCIVFFIFWNSIVEGKNPFRRLIHDPSFRKETGLILLTFAIPFFLTLGFVVSHSSSSGMEMPEFKYVIEWFSDVRPLIALDYDSEKIYAKPLFIFYVLIFISSIIRTIKARKEKHVRFCTSDGWLILSVIMILFFFFLPDDLISGGVVGIRFCLLGYLLLFIFFAANGNKSMILVGAFASVIVSFLMIRERYDSISMLSDINSQYLTCADKIENGSTLLTINYSNNWMLDNMATYIGAEKKILVLDNYEASQVHFPLRWKTGKNANVIIGPFATNRRPCLDLSAYRQKANVEVDYILLMEKPEVLDDSCSLDLVRQLSEHYKKIYTIPERHAELYKRF